MVIVLGIVAVAFTGLLARPLFLYTVGADYAAAMPFLVWYMAATVLLSLVMVVNSFYLARREGHFIPWLIAGTGLLIVLLLRPFTTGSRPSCSISCWCMAPS